MGHHLSLTTQATTRSSDRVTLSVSSSLLLWVMIGPIMSIHCYASPPSLHLNTLGDLAAMLSPSFSSANMLASTQAAQKYRNWSKCSPPSHPLLFNYPFLITTNLANPLAISQQSRAARRKRQSGVHDPQDGSPESNAARALCHPNAASAADSP